MSDEADANDPDDRTERDNRTDRHDRFDRLGAVLAPPLADLGISLYDVEITGSGRDRTLRVLIDRARTTPGDLASGVDLEDVTRATEALGPVLDTDPVVAAVLPGTYLLEVSSPGLERPLRTPAHFGSAVGTVVSLKARAADGGYPRNRALIVGADDDDIEIEVDGTRERVEYADIVQARTVFEWGPAPKPGAPQGKRKKPGAAKSPKSKPTVSASS
jgi:ribosome maturation factor RimP